MSGSKPAVFLSYASQDAETAKKICDALRTAGLEVWFDQNELVGGDAWDRKIRRQIGECALFVPVISAATQARGEGYFRLEWKLAVDRSHLMADDQAFLLPVVIDGTTEVTARVPDRFRERQWSRVADEGALAAFAVRASRMLAGLPVAPLPARRAEPPATPPPPSESPSIAVLAFANRSNDPGDEYFSDGLADELLGVLGKINGLRVTARTSAFSFKGKPATIAEIGRALNVATVLEGSVRKAGNRIRIMVQLVKVPEGFHLWSKTYDRTLDDVFAVQDEIAQAVVQELRATLMGELADAKPDEKVVAEIAAVAKGRSENGEAHRLMLQGRHLLDRQTGPDLERSIAYLEQAVAIDPGYAFAWAWLAQAYTLSAALGFTLVVAGNAQALAAAQRALELEPGLVEAHLAMSLHQLLHAWDWRRAEQSIQRALALAPASGEALSAAALLAFILGRLKEALELSHRAVGQDPLNSRHYAQLGRALQASDLLPAAEEAYRKALELSPDAIPYHLGLANILEKQGRHEEAVTEGLKEKASWARLTAMATLFYTGGQRAEADQALQELIASRADTAAIQIAQVYTTRGELDAAFTWLDRAYAQRDSGLFGIKVMPLWKVLHTDPRWEPFLRKMNLADDQLA